MREILFRAKRLDNGEWVEGYYYRGTFSNELKTYIKQNAIDNDEGKLFRYDINYEVDTNTLCQYTGLTDKNGLKIWENDILKGFFYPYLSDGKDNYYTEVIYFDNCPAFGIYTHKNPKSSVNGIAEGCTELMGEWDSENWEVIGNIFDNAELLEVK